MEVREAKLHYQHNKKEKWNIKFKRKKKERKGNPLLKMQGERWHGNSDYGGWEGTVTTSLQNEISGKLTFVCLEGKYFKPKSFPANNHIKV